MYNGTIVDLFTLNGGLSIIDSIGIVDIIMVIFICFLAFIALLNLISDGGDAIFGLVVFAAIVYFTTLYFYKIDNGIYLAETIEKNGKVIGSGIEEKYNFDIDNFNYVKIIDKKDKKYSSWNSIKEIKLTYNKTKSNYLVRTYEEKNSKIMITVSLFGTVYWHKPNGEIIAKSKVYN